MAIRICPEILFLDFDRAINRSNLLGRNLNFDYLSRGGQNRRKFYDFDATALINCLNASGHVNIS